MCFFSSSVSSLYPPSFVISATSKLSPLAESRFIAESIALTTTGTDSLTVICSFHPDSRTPYATGEPEPVETNFSSIMLPSGSSRSEEHTSELQSPIDTLSLHDALPIYRHLLLPPRLKDTIRHR